MPVNSNKSPRSKCFSAVTRCSYCSSSCSFDGLVQPDYPQALSAAEFAAHQASGRDQCIVPVSEHGFHVARYTLHHDGRDGHKGAVFFRDSEDAVFLGEEKGGRECLALRAGESADDANKR
jgi:hypothetical protein